MPDLGVTTIGVLMDRSFDSRLALTICLYGSLGLCAVSPTLAATLYTETNAATGNGVQVYVASADGNPTLSAEVPTGGRGTGAGLGSQGALAVSGDRRFLFAVNAGSNEISSFRIGSAGELTLLGNVGSSGSEPVSLTTRGNLLYVLDAGGTGNIAGFRVNWDGRLQAIPGSTQPLSSTGAGGAQIGFDREGERLVVTEKATNRIDVYTLRHGVAGPPQVHASHGQTPFGFAFDRRDDLLVSEAFGGQPGASALSSYDFDDGRLMLTSGSVPTQQTAACWVVTARGGRFAYVTNTGSGTVTGYAVAREGSLSLLNSDGVTGISGGRPTDAITDRDGDALYVLSPSISAIVSFRVHLDGSLARLGVAPGVAGSAAGLVSQ